MGGEPASWGRARATQSSAPLISGLAGSLPGTWARNSDRTGGRRGGSWTWHHVIAIIVSPQDLIVPREASLMSGGRGRVGIVRRPRGQPPRQCRR